eukprot:Lithocolla_globosa_v1_NODE_3785_length_1581_cov_3.616645.p1 type:complete len:223 gc:universal NODE_3785_length_1581_cov_3.616645:638-1306(+)
MKQDATIVSQQLDKLIKRLNNKTERNLVENLIIRLDSQFPGDVGCFCVFFMNYVKIQPSEALFLSQNRLHAYLSGDGVECMACSDNVVRAGLTPKLRDVDILVDILEYVTGTPESFKMTPTPLQKHSLLFEPPIPEFSILRTCLNKQAGNSTSPWEAEFEGFEGPSILLVVTGKGTIISQGQNFSVEAGRSYFIGSHLTLRLETEDELTVFRAFWTPKNRKL